MDRSEEWVELGSNAPTQALLDDAHRRILTQTALGIILVALVCTQWATELYGSGARLLSYALIAACFIGLPIWWFGYRAKARWAFDLAPFAVLGLASTYALWAITNLVTGQPGGFLMGVIAVIFAIHMTRLSRIVSDERLIHGVDMGANSQLNVSMDEVLARCPHCFSILAVVPAHLSLGDPCPVCAGKLVSEGHEDE